MTMIKVVKRQGAELIAASWDYQPDEMPDDFLYGLVESLGYQWDEVNGAWIYVGDDKIAPQGA